MLLFGACKSATHEMRNRISRRQNRWQSIDYRRRDAIEQNLADEVLGRLTVLQTGLKEEVRPTVVLTENPSGSYIACKSSMTIVLNWHGG